MTLGAFKQIPWLFQAWKKKKKKHQKITFHDFSSHGHPDSSHKNKTKQNKNKNKNKKIRKR